MKRKPINFPNPKYSISEYLQLRWDDTTWLDDIFEKEFFNKECIEKLVSHKFIERRGKTPGICDCILTVKGNIAKFNYIDIPDEKKQSNNKKDIIPGILTIVFTDKSRCVVKENIWQDNKKSAEEKNTAYTTWDSVPFGDEFSMPKSTAEKVKVDKKVRFAQNQFKEKLMDTYQRCCSISGCQTEDALEAAHIMPAGDENSYHVKNGLLLRADIHLLFDKGLIRIDPDTLEIHVSKTVTESGYVKFHGKTLRKTRDPRQAPDIQVLKWKWKNRII